MKQGEKTRENFALICFSAVVEKKEEEGIYYVRKGLQQEEYLNVLRQVSEENIVLVDADRIRPERVMRIISAEGRSRRKGEVGYLTHRGENSFMGLFERGWNKTTGSTPLLTGSRDVFLKAYAGADLSEHPLTAISYSLRKMFVRFYAIKTGETLEKGKPDLSLKLAGRYYLNLPLRYLFSGVFFRELFRPEGKARREMVYRMLLFLFALFTFVCMPFLSRDYGVSGDEFVDHRHAGYVLDYFKNGDKTALNQPKTALHLYGISAQVMAAFICEQFQVEDYYELRHLISALVGALGILYAGLLGLRWGGGLTGLLSALLLFFTPRYFGHSMNNLKDVPFAVGYLMSVYYTIRLFDFYPLFRWKYIAGLAIGIALALGTRSGGLVLYPMVLMYAGLFYIFYYGWRDSLRIGRHGADIMKICFILLVSGFAGYLLAIALWPFALQSPFSNVMLSLKQFTNFSVGLRTIFNGEQMMSNMLPWQYAPKFLWIGLPVVTVFGFIGYWIYVLLKRREFSLISFFLGFAALFPVVWVIYKSSNLYGGIRHLLFVIPVMVVVAAHTYALLCESRNKYLRGGFMLIFLVLLVLPVSHMIRNHPNEYVYYNELAGGMKGIYGDFETDYYFNSLKGASDWFKKNVILPADRKTVIATNMSAAVSYYFRKDTNVRVVYTRYYEKYSRDWDYALFGNVYVNRFQLQKGLFPPEGVLYAPKVDGYPVAAVLKRTTKEDLKGFRLEKEGKLTEALEAFEAYIRDHKENEEVWARMGKLYYMTRQMEKAESCLGHALALHPSLNEALYISALVNIQQKTYPQALDCVEKMLAENKFSPDAYYLKGLTLFHEKKYQEAVKVLNEGLGYRQEDERLWGLAGEIMSRNGNYKQAAEIYRRMLSIKKSVGTMVLLADSYCRQQDYKQCEEMLNQALQLQKDYYPAYRVLARMKYMQNRIPEMGQILVRLNGIGNDADLFVLRAYYFQNVGNQPEAQRMFKYALQVDPENQEALKFKS